jgi:hypothetical protein
MVGLAAASGDTTLLACIAGKRYCVHSFIYQLGGSASVTFKSVSTALTGAMPGVSGNGRRAVGREGV